MKLDELRAKLDTPHEVQEVSVVGHTVEVASTRPTEAVEQEAVEESFDGFDELSLAAAAGAASSHKEPQVVALSNG